MKSLMNNKKGAGVVSSLIGGTGNLIILTVIILIVVTTLLGANLLTDESEADNVTTRMQNNFTEGIDNISGKLPTILLIAAVVLLFGVLVILVKQSGSMTGSSGGSL